jgi:hypothetical protein
MFHHRRTRRLYDSDYRGTIQVLEQHLVRFTATIPREVWFFKDLIPWLSTADDYLRRVRRRSVRIEIKIRRMLDEYGVCAYPKSA